MKLPTLCRQAHHGLEVLLKDFFSLFRTVAVEKSFSSETSVGSGVGEAEETCDLTDPPPQGAAPPPKPQRPRPRTALTLFHCYLSFSPLFGRPDLYGL